MVTDTEKDHDLSAVSWRRGAGAVLMEEGTSPPHLLFYAGLMGLDEAFGIRVH